MSHTPSKAIPIIRPIPIPFHITPLFSRDTVLSFVFADTSRLIDSSNSEARTPTYFEVSAIRFSWWLEPVTMKLELTSNEAIKQAVIAGLGYSVMPLIGVHTELLTKDLQIVPVSGLPVMSTWRLIWLKNKKLSPVAQAFLDHIRENKAEILKKHFDWLDSF